MTLLKNQAIENLDEKEDRYLSYRENMKAQQPHAFLRKKVKIYFLRRPKNECVELECEKLRALCDLAAIRTVSNKQG